MASVGEAAACDFEAYGDAVYGWAFRIVGQHHDALDVVQDVFLKWARQCRDSVPQHPRGWLRRVTVNRAIDVRRQRANQPRVSVHDFDGGLEPRTRSDRGVDANPDAERSDLRDVLATALGRLTDAQRGVVAAKVFDGQTFSTIADELGLGIPTVKTHFLRGIRSLRDHLRARP